jgi:hypothetical protein
VQRATTAKVSIRAKGIRPFARVQLVQRRAMVAFFLKEMIACSLFFLLPSVHSLAFRPVCKAKGDIVLLLKDRVTGDVVRVDDDDGTRRLGNSREELVPSGLRGADLFDDKYWSEGIVPKSGSFAEQSRSLQEGDETFYMRECFCAYRGDYLDPVYCPLELEFCGAYRGSQYDGFPLACFSQVSRAEEFSQNVFLVILVWFVILFVWVFCSVPGRHFLSCFISPCIPSWNRYHANRIMRRDPEMAQFLIRRNLHFRRLAFERRLRAIAPDLAAMANENQTANMQQQQQVPEENKPVPTSLRLKTRIYKLEGVEKTETGLENIDDEEDLDTNCIICFQALADGDRVGALLCTHIFHVDCLKSWLKRRNVCPLCQCPDVAAPRFEELPTEENAVPEEAPTGTQVELPLDNGSEE